MISSIVVSVALLLCSTTSYVDAFASQVSSPASVALSKDVSRLVKQNKRVLDSLSPNEDDECDEITRLRFALAFDTKQKASKAYDESRKYRSKGRGKVIVDSAQDAFEQASIGGGWDNEVVRKAAPHADVINKFITSQNIITTSNSDGDLIYVIRASAINDKKMMDVVSVTQLSEFFMYVKEIHNLVANQRSKASGRLCEVIFANDITGVRKPPDSRFAKALSSSSSQYETLYPSLAGPTLIVNLPFILLAFVRLFKPLFPKTVQARLKFIRAPVLASFTDLSKLAEPNNRKRFLAETEKLVKQ